MTIEELLAIDRRNVNQADRMHDATSAAIALSAAQTAQAMIAAEELKDNREWRAALEPDLYEEAQ